MLKMADWNAWFLFKKQCANICPCCAQGWLGAAYERLPTYDAIQGLWKHECRPNRHGIRPFGAKECRASYMYEMHRDKERITMETKNEQPDEELSLYIDAELRILLGDALEQMTMSMLRAIEGSFRGYDQHGETEFVREIHWLAAAAIERDEFLRRKLDELKSASGSVLLSAFNHRLAGQPKARESGADKSDNELAAGAK